MGTIPDATAEVVKEKTGIEVKGYNAILPADFVRHIFSHHGNEQREGMRGQRAVTEEDIVLLPAVLSNPDSVSLSDHRDQYGRYVILFSKGIGDTYVTAQAVTDGRHALSTLTMWIKKESPTDTTSNVGERADPALHVQDAPPSELSDTIIRDGAQGVKGKYTQAEGQKATDPVAARVGQIAEEAIEAGGGRADLGQISDQINREFGMGAAAVRAGAAYTELFDSGRYAVDGDGRISRTAGGGKATARPAVKNRFGGGTQAQETQKAVPAQGAETEAVITKLRDSIPLISQSSPVAQVTTEEVNKSTGETMAQKARRLFNEIIGTVTRHGFGAVEISGRSVKDDLSHGVGAAKAAVIPSIPNVIKYGTQIEMRERWKGRPYDGYIFAAPVSLDGQTVHVAAVVKKTTKNRFYLHEVVDSTGNIIKISTGDRANPTSLAADGDAGTQSPVPSDTIIRDGAQGVKGKYTRVEGQKATDPVAARVGQIAEEAIEAGGGRADLGQISDQINREFGMGAAAVRASAAYTELFDSGRYAVDGDGRISRTAGGGKATARPAVKNRFGGEAQAQETQKAVPAQGAEKRGKGGPGSIRDMVGAMPSAGYQIPHIAMPESALLGTDGAVIPESKIPAAIRKYMNSIFKGKVLNIGTDHKVYVGREGIREFAFPAKRFSGELKTAKMTAGANLDTTLGRAVFLLNTDDDGRHPEAIGGWDNFYVMFETSTGVYSGIVKTEVTDRGRVFHDITEIQKEGEMPTHSESGGTPTPAKSISPSDTIIRDGAQGVKGEDAQGIDQKNEEKSGKRKGKKENGSEKESKPTIAKRELKARLNALFSTPSGEKAAANAAIDAAAEQVLRAGALTEKERTEFFNRLYSANRFGGGTQAQETQRTKSKGTAGTGLLPVSEQMQQSISTGKNNIVAKTIGGHAG